MKKILVTGSSGQLGNCLRKISDDFSEKYIFDFTDSASLDITDASQVEEYFRDLKPDYCINAAAYTDVDAAETDSERAFAINRDGVANLAEACKNYGVTLIHVSTDYVFDGDTNISYDEDNFTNPTGVYGLSKKEGEEAALEANPRTIILRTSWLYSEFNKNFVKTMLSLFKTKVELNIVADQYGQPTNANDLAEAIMTIIEYERKQYGIFHFSNYPETTWFDFAAKIAELSGSKIELKPVSTDQFPTAAKRPARSTMSLDKIERIYHIQPNYWENSLEDSIKTIIQNHE
ncbi:dTDP-4-dehydrorhamnose reductase [Chryseobacterium sp.]|uniref:dTDP-4-dehydrorhamnose reductase n=1 Tax=Chryseobacterium sp. TaxID=1871047 RepID=UPI0011CC9122|nr:dTDP-4-dehydrorhamnose reductase [Chryseobacterium sp.]TXF75790.1 dTDP-4-dehydrorhamnose reductase [Chryseobacterium sp.]